MVEYTTEKYASVSPQKIDDLMAIYDDYLYMVRQHEQILHEETIDEFAFKQVKCMYHECSDPQNFIIPWQIFELNKKEKQEFFDFTENNTAGKDHKTYVSLQHIKSEENEGHAPHFSIFPYLNHRIIIPLPSMIEKYTLSYSPENTFGNTEFFIDGRYKAIYSGEKIKDKHISDCANDQDLLAEITIMLNLGEAYRQNGYVEDDKFRRKVVNIYAAEMISMNENHLLEIMGSFADKIKDICHSRYHEKDGENDIKRAQEDGYLNLPEDFQDYINIRNFMRHQWDTLNDLDDFSLQKSQENKQKRAERTNSYLKFCDKTIYQRMNSYVDVLPKMQQIICEINSNRLIRGISESNSKFIERIKATYKQNPNIRLEVETNYPLTSHKYLPLIKSLHKIFPDIKIVDDFSGDNSKQFERMIDYERRSSFLQNLHTLECYAMEHCQVRGKNKDNRQAWNYMQEIGVITREECQIIQDYTDLRNNLCHNYYDDNLRKKLRDNEEKFFHDFQNIAGKLHEAGPEVRKLEDDVYEYEQNNGKVVTLNYNTHEVSYKKNDSKTEFRTESKPKKETYRNGIEFIIKDEEITGVKLPNGVYINIAKQSIDWGDETKLYASAENFNALQTPKSTIRTDKEFKVTGYFEKNRRVSFRKGDDLLIDYRHRLLLDNMGRIKEFNFKNSENKIIKTEFKHNKDGHNTILFTDGTNLIFSGKEVSVIHNNKVLSYDTRKEFAFTYDKTQSFLQQNHRNENAR